MKEYLTKSLRNVAILGHLGSGKTTLTESMLYVSKAIAKKGEVEKKTTVSDYLTEEQSRQTSLSTSLIPIEWNNHKINCLDTPGSEEFVYELEQDLTVVKGAILVIDATKGVEVGTERVWAELRKRHIPTIIFVNKMDKDNIKFDKVYENIREVLGKRAIPLTWPLGHDDGFDGFVNAVERRARIFNGITCTDAEVYPEKMAKCDELHDAICEAVAETSEELMEKFFGGETLTKEELLTGIRVGTLAGEIYPVLVGAASKNIGVQTLLTMVCDYMPAPDDLNPIEGVNPSTKDKSTRNTEDDEPFSAYVFKTMVDPFLGTINYFKVFSGSTANLQEAYSPSKDSMIKLGQISTIMGKNIIPVEVLHAGDIGIMTKTADVLTGDTLCDKRSPIEYPRCEIPTATIYVAISAKTKQDEDKMSVSLQKLNLEDPSFEIRRNRETSQLLIGGQGMTHIGYILEKMKNMFKVEVTTSEQKIVYRETIRKTADGHGRHKKQSGGAGQFGEVYIRFEPCEAPFEFASEVVGGAVSKGYFPAVEKGLIDTFEHGPLAGFPVIGVRAVLFDGSEHPVDSNEISFKLAASLAFKDAQPRLKPTILEPIVEVKVEVKAEYVGDIITDMNKRRGQLLGIDILEGGHQVVTATVPEAEIIKYTIDLKAMTQGSGHFTRHFVRYDDVPEQLVSKIVSEYKVN